MAQAAEPPAKAVESGLSSPAQDFDEKVQHRGHRPVDKKPIRHVRLASWLHSAKCIIATDTSCGSNTNVGRLERKAIIAKKAIKACSSYRKRPDSTELDETDKNGSVRTTHRKEEHIGAVSCLFEG